MASCALLILCGFLSASSLGHDIAYNITEQARLRAGEVLIEDVTNDTGVRGLKAAFLIKAPSEAIWELLIDYTRFREVFTGIKELWVLDESEQGARVRFHIRVAIVNFYYILQRDYQVPGRRLTWHRVDGDFKHISGRWEIRDGPDSDHQLVIYESFVDVGFLIPTALVRNGAVDELQDTVLRMRQQLLRRSLTKPHSE